MHFCHCWCYLTGIYVCVIMPINDVPRKTPWNCPMSVWTSFLYLGGYHRALFTSIWESLPSQFVICRNFIRPWRGILTSITRALCSWESTHVHFWHEYEKLHCCQFWCYVTGIAVHIHIHTYIHIHIYICYNVHKRCTTETFFNGSDVYLNVFSVLRSTPSNTIDTNLRSCVLNRHKLRQSQIVTNQESLPSQFVIRRNLWSRPWRHKLSPITLKTCSVYLGEYPCSLLTWIWKFAFLPILVLFHWYICLCVCLSVIKPIIDVPRRPSWKGPILMWTCFMHLGVYPRLLWNLSEKLCFEPSQIATVTNCDTFVAICDLLQFVIEAVTGQTQSNNTENVFWVLGRVPRFTFYMNMKSCIFTHFGVISLVYLFVCMYISYKAHNRCTQETLFKGSNFDVNMFSALRTIPSVTM